MIYRTDFDKFQKQDNAAILEFLSSAASALSSADAISQKESADLRISFRNIHHLVNKQEISILQHLADEKNDFLRILLNRYGVVGFDINLFRFTTRGYLNQYNSILSRLGVNLIEKADLFFNRLFGVYVKDSCESKFLFAGVIIRLASFMEKCTRMIDDVANPLSKLYPSNMVLANALDHKVDQLMAKHLGFSGVEQDFLPYFTEKCLKIHLADSFLSVVTSLEDFLIQFKQNGHDSSTSSMEFHINWIKGECGKLFNQDFIISDNLHHQENFRRTICSCLFTIMDSFQNLADGIVSLMTPSCFGKNEHFMFSDDIRRRIASDLIIKTKTPPYEAEDASRLLLQYCNTQNLSPNELIHGELTKIHPSLTWDALNAIQTAQNNYTLASDHSEEKIAIASTAKHLSIYFANILKRIVPVLLAALILSSLSCGIKTAPRSSIEDFRPDLPSRPVPREVKGDNSRITHPKGETDEKK